MQFAPKECAWEAPEGRPTRLGIDFRPALVNREGIGRVARETVRALGAGEPAIRLRLFGATLAAPRLAASELDLPASARLFRVRVPSRIWRPLRRLTGLGADDLLGGVDVFHHTQLNHLPVRRAIETATIFDTLYLDGGSGFVDPPTAARMERHARALVERCARLQVPTEHVAHLVAAQLGADPDRIDVVPLGCDHATRVTPDLGRTPRGPYLLTVARLDPRKNHVTVLRAFERLVAAGLPHRWIIAGPPGYRCDAIAAALRDSPAADRIEWRRSVDERELAALYADARLFAFPSLAEGFGLPPLEAMAHGCPVIASDEPVLNEVLGTAAVHIAPLDVDGWFEALREGLELDRTPQREAAARAHAAGWTWDQTAGAVQVQLGRLRSQTSS
ncbi:glycosyltransferase family 4 protein [Engelhardtia mirabilis]|uniref:D-inositol 3-phosphate glycosyltransferase n=1 Tax=Engelhardtia mirabilis TaxID=2528011 RepID=A0A518BIS9_9BACT|nr:D-inositol 3-phosphate glycosyltransferase [Planctomycetes bacterium Pla133]QDV01179.1 D-inositol 3-phosphate glycosyltransferase [Planctomycetes bacterium Pla86]